MQSTNEEEGLDPFSPQAVGAFSLIALMRLYDVGMALLNETSPEVAARLAHLHAQGKVIGHFPSLDMEAETEA